MAREKYIISRFLIRNVRRVEDLFHALVNHLISQPMAVAPTRRHGPSDDTDLGHQAKQHVSGFHREAPQFQKKLRHHMIRKNFVSPWGMIDKISSAQTTRALSARRQTNLHNRMKQHGGNLRSGKVHSTIHRLSCAMSVICKSTDQKCQASKRLQNRTIMPRDS